MSRRTFDLADILRPLDDSRLIDGIFNYCTRRCEQCALTDRCRRFRDLQEQRQTDWDRGVPERVQGVFNKTLELLQAWGEREGIDIAQLQADAESVEVRLELRRMEETRNDPLQRLAETYTYAALKLAPALERNAPPIPWPEPVTRALDTIMHLALPISSKIYRALSGYVRRVVEIDDVVQNDWNGSARVAHLAIDETIAAWETILSAGEAAVDAPPRKLIELLELLDSALARRFPRSEEFVRPGFDEPAVAAGAQSTLAALEPRGANSNPMPQSCLSTDTTTA